MDRSEEIQRDTNRCKEIWRDIKIYTVIGICKDIERYRKIQRDSVRSRDLEI